MNDEHELIDAYLDGELTPDGERQLARWLAVDSENVRDFVREAQLHRQIREAMLARQFQAGAVAAPKRSAPGLRSSPLRQFVGRLTRFSKTAKVLFGFGGHRSVAARPKTFKPTRTWNGRRRSGALQGKRLWTSLKPVLALAASVAVLIGLAIWLFPSVTNEPTLALASGAQVTIRRGTEEFPGKDELRLQPGDTLLASGTNVVALRYGTEPTRVLLFDGTDLKLTAFASGKRFELVHGKIEATVARQRPWQSMLLQTAQGEARVVGTKFTLAVTTNATRLEVTEGRVKLTRKSDDASVKVSAGLYAVAATNYELAAHPLTGGIFREDWTNLAGGTLAYLITHTNYPDRPDGWSYLTNLSQLKMPSNWGDNFGVRLRGYIHAPETGDYTFWIAARDDASLWLSPDEDPENKIHMAHSDDAASQDWQSDAAQQSATVPFVAGRRYYFEVLHAAAVGDDHLALAWQRPGGTREVIPGQYLSPFETKPKPKEKKR